MRTAVRAGDRVRGEFFKVKGFSESFYYAGWYSGWNGAKGAVT